MPLYDGQTSPYGPSGQQQGLPVSGVGATSLPPGIEGVPVIVNGQIIGWNIGGEFFTQEEVDSLIATGTFPDGAAGGGAAGPSWKSGEYELEQKALQHQIEQDKADLAWAQKQFGLAQAAEDRRAMEYAQLQIQMLEKRLDNDNRQLMFSATMAERQTLIQEKGLARERRVERAGRDPMRFAFNVRGQAAPTVTPEDVFKAQDVAFINAPLPQVNMGMSLPQMQAALTQTQALQPPIPGPFMGMARGGVIDMEKGGNDVFSMRPKASWLIGEGQHGEGLAMGTAEVLTVEKGPFGIKSVEVTPLAGAAQGGLSYDPSMSPAVVSGGGQTQYPTLGAIYNALLGTSTFGGSQIREAFAGVPMSFLQSLGPERFASVARGEMPSMWGEQIRSGLAMLQLAPTRALANLPFLQAARAGLGPVSPGAYGYLPEGAAAPPVTGTLPQFQATASPLTLERALSEMGVPRLAAGRVSEEFGPFAAPFKQANFLGLGMSNLQPQERTTFESLYGLMGYTPEDINYQIRAATPTGRFDRPQRIGFRGTQL